MWDKAVSWDRISVAAKNACLKGPQDEVFGLDYNPDPLDYDRTYETINLVGRPAGTLFGEPTLPISQANKLLDPVMDGLWKCGTTETVGPRTYHSSMVLPGKGCGKQPKCK